MSPVAAVEPAPEEIGTRVRRGLAWKLFSQVMLQGSRLAVAVVLARLLTPKEFGVAAMVLVMSAFVIPFADLGMGSALVQRPSLDEDDRSTMFWTSVGAGVFFTVVGIACAPLVERFYDEPKVAALFTALSFNFIITALGSTHRSLLARAMDFRSLEIRVMTGVAIGAVVGISTAAAGYGAWALVLQEITIAAVSTALLWLMNRWRPRFLFSRKSFVELGSFGYRNLVSSFFLRMTQNADNLLIGRFLGAVPLGLYALAYNTMVTPLTRVVAPIQEVVYPALSRLQQDREALKSTWMRATRGVCMLCFPLMLGLIVVAPDFVPAVFGAHWEKSVPVLQILAVVGAVQGIQSQHANVLAALNQTKILLRVSTISFVVNIAAFVIGLHWGILGVATCFAVSSGMLVVLFTAVAANAAQVSLLEFFRNIAGVAAVAVAMMGICWLARRLLLEVDARRTYRLLAVLFIGGAVFIPVAALFNRDFVENARDIARRFKARRAASAGSSPA